MGNRVKRNITLSESLLAVAFLIVSLFTTIKLFGGSPHIPLVVGTMFASLIAIRAGYKWVEIQEGIIDTIKVAMEAIIILMIIGMIIGTWILAGVVPTMIYYGLKIISPSIFLVATCLICAIVSVATGSSWSTIGTVGIALLGIGSAGLGIPKGIVAGAIISGSYFGDKMSPLSDTTNLAPAVAGAKLFDHIKHMIYTTGPSMIIALTLYGIIGMKYSNRTLDVSGINILLNTFKQQFFISPLLLIPPIIVLILVVLKIPAVPGLMSGAVLGGLFAAIFQGADLSAIIKAAHYGYSSNTGVQAVDSLLSRGGLNSMMWTISLVITAMAFGGVMEKTGMIKTISDKILTYAKTTGSLVLATVITCIFTNFTTAVQYLGIVLPGRTYKDAYAKRGLHPKNLSRVLEDSGTLTSALVPWSTDAAFIFGVLGIKTLTFAPYAFLLLINPFVSIIYGYTGITMTKLEEPIEVKEQI